MDMQEYSERVSALAVYPGQKTLVGLMYCALKLNGEAGEVADKIGKMIRDAGLVDVIPQPDEDGDKARLYRLTDLEQSALMLELGDVLWYVQQMALELGSNLTQVAARNILKLESRRDRGTLHGSGDNR